MVRMAAVVAVTVRLIIASRLRRHDLLPVGELEVHGLPHDTAPAWVRECSHHSLSLGNTLHLHKGLILAVDCGEARGSCMYGCLRVYTKEAKK